MVYAPRVTGANPGSIHDPAFLVRVQIASLVHALLFLAMFLAVGASDFSCHDFTRENRA
jgi:hypothetical protein